LIGNTSFLFAALNLVLETNLQLAWQINLIAVAVMIATYFLTFSGLVFFLYRNHRYEFKKNWKPLFIFYAVFSVMFLNVYWNNLFVFKHKGSDLTETDLELKRCDKSNWFTKAVELYGIC